MQNKYSKFVNTEELRKTRENKGFSIRDMSKLWDLKVQQLIIILKMELLNLKFLTLIAYPKF